MKKLMFAALAAGAILATGGAASAQSFYFGVGPGYDGPRYVYRDRYDGPRYRRYYREPRGYRAYGRYYGGRSSSNLCPPHYTVQSGVCKPYRCF